MKFLKNFLLINLINLQKKLKIILKIDMKFLKIMKFKIWKNCLQILMLYLTIIKLIFINYYNILF